MNSLLHSLLSGQRRAVDCVAEAFIDLAQAAKRVAATFQGGGRLIYLGAGPSGLLAMQDGLELPGAFGVEAEKIRFVTPNSERLLVDGSAEDDSRLTEEADPLPDTAIARSAGPRASASIARPTQNFAPARKRSSRGSLASAKRLRRRLCASPAMMSQSPSSSPPALSIGPMPACWSMRAVPTLRKFSSA